MNPMIKWIGGATAALVLLVGGGTLASEMMASEPAPATPSLEQAIPVDEAALNGATTDELAQPGTNGADPEFISQEVVQEIPEKPVDDKFVIKRILPIDGPIKYGEWHWDDEGVPAGPIIMTVDLDARVISVFKGGYEIGAAAVLLGTDEHPTPLGTFPIRYKMRQNSNGEWKVRNVTLSSVNLGKVYSNQFASAAKLYNGDIDKVIANWVVESQEIDE
mgnify:CR=1 FL=1